MKKTLNSQLTDRYSGDNTGNREFIQIEGGKNKMSKVIKPVRTFRKDKLKVKVYENSEKMGTAVAFDVSEKIKNIIKEKGQANVIFATGSSQGTFLKNLSIIKGIDWGKVNVFDQDEFIGIPEGSSQCFATILKNKIFNRVKPGQIFLINGNVKNIEEECKRFTDLLNKYPTDIALIGIGENGHIAFNDPHVADFNDPKMVKKVELDEKCKNQEVKDFGFKNINEVPEAITITIPAILKAKYISIVVPEKHKARIVKVTLYDGISTKCPATILRTHENANLYLDADSYNLLA